MDRIDFEWDPKKANSNRKKHGVTFEEAKDSFYDPFGDRFWDEGSSEFEDRFLWLGKSPNGRTLLVSHCFRNDEGVIRIISARKATKNEQKEYRGLK